MPGTEGNGRPASGLPVEVGLVLTDAGNRSLNTAPAQIGVGAVRMRGWQVHPVRPAPGGFAGQHGYLIKVNYDLALEREVPVPPWFEIGLALSCPDGEGPVAVVDAMPRSVLEPQEPAAYAVSEYLSLVPATGNMGRSIQLPAMAPFIDAFGIGGDEIRWRHTSGVRPGSYSALMVLVTPAGCGEVAVGVSARFDLGPEASRGKWPSHVPASFVLGLTGPSAAQPEAGIAAAAPTAVATSDGTPVPASPARPRIFVSYTHDDLMHIEAVRAFCEFLRAGCGLDVHVDRWDTAGRREWSVWAIDQIERADFVLVIASPMSKLVGDGQVANDSHRGMQWEMSLIRERLQDDRATWLRKLLPVVLPGRSVGEIPVFLQPQTADHYLVTENTEAGAEDLLRVITGQSAYPPPPMNSQVVSLPPLLYARDTNPGLGPSRS